MSTRAHVRHNLTGTELRATGALSAIFATRLLGLFMIYPIFVSYAERLRGATPELIGIALGAYGLTQGFLQIPFGVLSDRVGRKTMIVIGLVFLGVGSVVAATSGSIYGVLLGRVLQGIGAVGSVLLAFVADLTRDEVRTEAFGFVGVTIGASFVLAIALGPIIGGAYGVAGAFWLTALFAVLGIGIVLFLVPRSARHVSHRETVWNALSSVLADGRLLELDLGIFALQAILIASFLAIPTLLTRTLHISDMGDWRFYVPMLIAAVVLMVPMLVLAERYKRMRAVFVATLVVQAATLASLVFFAGNPVVLIIALTLFFSAFTIMEALLPSLVTKVAPPSAKGAATGVYSSAQSLGIFAGGTLGGIALGMGGAPAVLAFALLVSLVWLALVVYKPFSEASYAV